MQSLPTRYRVFEPGQAYVMLSRVQCIEQLYVVGELNEEKIRASPAALEELKRLQQISFNRNPSPWHKRNSTAIKIGSVNCLGLLAHLRDIRFISIGNGRGIGTFIREDVTSEHKQDIVKPSLQITKFSVRGLDIISVYRSSNHSIPDVSQALDSLIDVEKPTIITGDFNVCTKKNASNGVTVSLQKKGFKSIIERPTHIQGGHIDHIYWLDVDDRYNLSSVEVYSPYWSDHDGLLVTITERYLIKMLNYFMN